MMKFLVGGAIAALAIGFAPVVAQPAPPTPPGVASGVAPVAPVAPRARMNVMSDRVMTRAEVPQHVGKLFTSLDTNRDGFITRDEVEAMHQKMAGAMGKAGNIRKRLAYGGLLIGDRTAMFDRLDTNHDGNISRQEFTAARPEVRERRVFVMREGAAPGARMRVHRMGMGGFGGHLFEMADANKDGRVSLAEAQAAALAHFDKADANRDGRITPDERREMRHVRIERRGS